MMYSFLMYSEQIEVELLREDSVMSVTVPLFVAKDLCPVHFAGRPPSYFVLGGLVFTVMSSPYLEVCFTALVQSLFSGSKKFVFLI